MPSHPGLGTRRDGVTSGFGGNRDNHACRYSWQVTQCHSDCDRNGKIAQDRGREETTRLGSCNPGVSTPAGIRDLAVHGDAAAIARGVTARLDAGADHVATQVLNPDPLPALRALAGQLHLTTGTRTSPPKNAIAPSLQRCQ